MGRPVSVPSIGRTVAGYQWADRVLPQGQVSLGAVAEALGIGRHQARRVVVKSGLPYEMHRRSWPEAGTLYTRRAIGVTASVLHVLAMLRMEKILARFPERRPLTGRWRQQKWRARCLSWGAGPRPPRIRLPNGRWAAGGVRKDRGSDSSHDRQKRESR